MNITWDQPRRVEEWWWMDLNELNYDEGDIVLVKNGRISWNADGTGFYKPSITFEEAHGLGLYCWPAFRALSDAQDFVEKLMAMPLEEVEKLHGVQWPDVVL